MFAWACCLHLFQTECFWTTWTVTMEAVSPSKTSVTIYQPTRHHIREDLKFSSTPP